MVRRAALAGLLSTAISAVAWAGTGVAAVRSHSQRQARNAGGVLIPSRSGTQLPLHGGTVDSLNWSGYAVTPGSGVTSVSSIFVVPKAGLVPPGFAASWTGIGGYNTSDLIQAGTTEDSLGNAIIGPQYGAWYEILPAAETPLTGCAGDANCTVTPGETVAVSISNVGANQWKITEIDYGHWSWSKTISYASSESSAEWILEAPTLVVQTPLANVGTAMFGPTNSYAINGGSGKTIAQGNPTTIDLSPGVINEATPSPLAPNGMSFNSCAYKQTCPTP